MACGTEPYVGWLRGEVPSGSCEVVILEEVMILDVFIALTQKIEGNQERELRA